jgi:membrane fusion protein (multidrug efflux system)
VKVGERYGANWIVREGLNPGERIIAEGTLKARDGVTVDPVAYQPKPEARR